MNQVLPALGKPFDSLPLEIQRWVQTVTVVAGGGTFILTSLLWATALSHLIDGRVKAASVALALAGLLSFFGIIHSPLSSAPISMPGAVVEQLRQEGRYTATANQTPYHWSAAYVLSAATLLALGKLGRPPHPVKTAENDEP